MKGSVWQALWQLSSNKQKRKVACSRSDSIVLKGGIVPYKGHTTLNRKLKVENEYGVYFEGIEKIK